MKLAFAIATVAALHQAAVTHAECDFGSNYTSYYNDSGYCSFDVGIGVIRNFSETNTISSGDANITTYTYRGENFAIWKIDDKDSTVQCYSNVSGEAIITSYPNGSMFQVETGDTPFELNSNDTVADGVPLSLVLGYTIFKKDVLNFGGSTTEIIFTLPKQRVISLICVKYLVVEKEVMMQLLLRLPHLQLRKLLAVDKWLL